MIGASLSAATQQEPIGLLLGGNNVDHAFDCPGTITAKMS